MLEVKAGAAGVVLASSVVLSCCVPGVNLGVNRGQMTPPAFLRGSTFERPGQPLMLRHTPEPWPRPLSAGEDGRHPQAYALAWNYLAGQQDKSAVAGHQAGELVLLPSFVVTPASDQPHGRALPSQLDCHMLWSGNTLHTIRTTPPCLPALTLSHRIHFRAGALTN